MKFTQLLAPCCAWFIVVVSACAPNRTDAAEPLYRIDPRTPAALQKIFRRTDRALPLVSAHRGGGAQQGFPENCLATFEHTLQHTFAMLEIDPRYAKDGTIVVHHDATLDRTTTGQGKVADFTVAQLKQLRLKDANGDVTPYQIPTLDEVFDWARGKTILVLDQKDVSVAARVKAIERHHAEGYAMLIVNSFADAEACYKLNPQIMMEVMIPNREKVAQFEKLSIPWTNVIAFVGHNPPEDLQLYELLHSKGVCCMIGTSRNLDRQLLTNKIGDLREIESDYHAFLRRGADLIETDIPVPLGTMLHAKTEVPEQLRSYFRIDQRDGAKK